MITTRILPLVLLLPCLGGCLFTGPMWHDANARIVVEPAVVAVLAPQTGVGGASAAGSPLLVIRYSVNAGADDLYATVPLTPDGCPAEPFAYAGAARTPPEVADALPASQRQRLRETRFTLHDEKWATRVRSGPRFRKVRWETDGRSVSYDAVYDGEGRSRRVHGWDQAEVRVRALRLGRPWTEAESDAMPLPVGSPITYPADACILVLPYAQPRPAGHRAGAQVRAALWTPLTLLGDAVVVPYIFIMCYGFGLCP